MSIWDSEHQQTDSSFSLSIWTFFFFLLQTVHGEHFRCMNDLFVTSFLKRRGNKGEELYPLLSSVCRYCPPYTSIISSMKNRVSLCAIHYSSQHRPIYNKYKYTFRVRKKKEYGEIIFISRSTTKPAAGPFFYVQKKDIEQQCDIIYIIFDMVVCLLLLYTAKGERAHVCAHLLIPRPNIRWWCCLEMLSFLCIM